MGVDLKDPFERDWGGMAPWERDDPVCDECGGNLDDIDGELMCLECEGDE